MLAIGSFGAVALCCSDEVVRLDLPVQADTKAIIIGIEHAGRLSVTAVDPHADPGAGLLPVIDPFEREARMTAALYDRTLADLGLEAAVEAEPDPNRAHRLESPDGLYESVLTAGSSPEDWRAVEAPSPAFSAFRRTGPLLCETFETRPVSPAITDGTHALAGLADGSVFAGTLQGRYFVIDETGATELDVSIARPFVPLSAVQVASGEIWIGGASGKVRRGTLETGFVAADAPIDSNIHGIAGARGTARDEIFVLADDGAFLRFFDDQWELIRAGGSEEVTDRLGVAWVSSGRALATTHNLGSVLHYDAAATTRLRSERIEILFGDGTDVEHIDGFGSVLTTKLHRIFRVTTELEDLAFAPFRDTLNAIAAYRETFVTVGDAGSIFQYQPDVACPVADISQPDAFIIAAAPLGESALVLSGFSRSNRTVNTVFVITPR